MESHEITVHHLQELVFQLVKMMNEAQLALLVSFHIELRAMEQHIHNAIHV